MIIIEGTTKANISNLRYLIILFVDLDAACIVSPKIKEDGPIRKETIVRRSFDKEIKYIFSAAYAGKTNEPIMLRSINKVVAAVMILDMSDKISVLYIDA